MQMIYKDVRKCEGTLTMVMSWSTTSLPYWLTYSLHCSEEAGGGITVNIHELHYIHITSIAQSELSPVKTWTAPAGRTGSRYSQ